MGRRARHYPFWNFPLQDKDIMCSVGANISLELDHIHLKGFGNASTNHLSASGLFSSLMAPLAAFCHED